MVTLTDLGDFRPIEKLVLPDLGELDLSGLTLIVGPNSAGKSQLLKDVYQKVSGEPRNLVVASEIVIRMPDFNPFIKWMESEGYFEEFYDENGALHWRPRTTYLGTGQAASQIQPNQAEAWHRDNLRDSNPKIRRRNEFLYYFGRMLVTGLFLDRRLTSLNQVGVIDFENQPPQQELHALYLDDLAKQRLFDELRDSFGKGVWPDTARGSVLCLRVSDEGILPTAEDRLSPKKMSTFRTVETEGDGLKSYVATCVALLLGARPVCLIDEPEMCLHPPQAYNLGRFIGRYGTSGKTATLVATHSSQILRGVIQTAREIKIVRLTRKGKNFSAHLVPAEMLAEAVAKPTVRAESILDGIFAQSVLVLESDGDRLVYQAAWETLSNELRLDIHFATVGGVGGIADTCRLYRSLKIPVAVVADLDMVSDPARLRRVLQVMASATDADLLSQRAMSIVDVIRRTPPTISPGDVAASLARAIPKGAEWVDEEDANLRRELSRLTQKLDRMRRLKRGGITALEDSIQVELVRLVDDLKSHGIFLVPVGELEGWLSGAQLSESRENKWAWANAAALHIQSKGAASGDVWDFVREVGRYLVQK